LLFLMPSVGVHLDLTFCCGNLDTVSVVHSPQPETTNCCVMAQGKSCNTSIELIVPQKLLDASPSENTPKLSSPYTPLAFITIGNNPNTNHNKNAYDITPRCNKPPSCSMLQVFLC
jgi:hypothetical protein